MSSEPLTTALLTSAVWVAIAVAAHFTVFHFARVERRARALLAIFGLALVGYLWTASSLDVDRWRLVYGVVVLGCAIILYLPFYYTIAASQSVQMLIEIHAARDGLALHELRQRFAVDRLLAGRLATMVGSGYLVHRQGGFAPTAKGRVVARCFRTVKILWRLGPGG